MTIEKYEEAKNLLTNGKYAIDSYKSLIFAIRSVVITCGLDKELHAECKRTKDYIIEYVENAKRLAEKQIENRLAEIE